MSRRSASAWLDQAWYPQYSSNWDSEALRGLVLARLEPEHDLLDFGAGAGIVQQMDFRGIARKVTGIDPDPRVLNNALLDAAFVSGETRLPFEDCSFDIVVACNVLEHLQTPARSLSEICRVLRPGGYFCFKTPNRLHYVALGATVTPHRFHEWFMKRRGRAPSDTFPTHYAANSRRRLRGLALETGFLTDALCVIEGRPEYLRFNPALYSLGAAYERIVNSTALLEDLRVVILGVFRRPS